ncbi:hypothetical protein [Pseudomonas sp. SG20052]|uniref:hypothetical protein n=1 Tax=Pseudomonas sp. SG20052 TaxID=3074147 RepID=UPI00287F4E3A|nr:hypothetical protein [Pseudomonas sp. SG20052]WNF57347.1 hypothetical protein RHP74_08630 [Pseudomonas sp. SG20052]
MKYSLEGKKVLYVAPRFFGYETEIKNELVRRGAEVDFLLDRPFDTPLLKAITRLRREWVIGAADRYYQAQLDELGSAEYDYVLVVSGQTLSCGTLALWREKYPRAQFLLYMWDSFANRQWALDNLQYFDHTFSFDRNDSEKYNLHFRPLFFSTGFEAEQKQPPEFDVSFIGTAHSDRYSVVSKVNKALGSSLRKYWYLYLQAKWVFWVYLLLNRTFRGAKLSDFRFDPLTKSTVQSVFFSSKAILDIEHPKQTGLTMRTLETTGAKKKLITTNQNVKDYDFYLEQNICVIDRHSPSIPSSFFQTPYLDLDPEVYQRYRLEGWLDELLSVVNKSA